MHRAPLPPELQRRLGVVPGVLGDVLQRLEAAVVDGSLAILGEAANVLDLRRDRHGRPASRVVEGRHEPTFGEHGRIDPVRNGSKVVQRLVELGCRVGRERPSRSLSFEGELEVNPQRDELLLHAVVEVTLDLPPLGRRGRDEPPLRRAQRPDGVEQILLETPVLEGQQRRDSDRVDELRILAENRVVHDGEDASLAVTERAPGLPGVLGASDRPGCRGDRRSARAEAARTRAAPADRRARSARAARRRRPTAGRRAGSTCAPAPLRRSRARRAARRRTPAGTRCASRRRSHGSRNPPNDRPDPRRLAS